MSLWVPESAWIEKAAKEQAVVVVDGQLTRLLEQTFLFRDM
jgi:hypothetical protein